MGIFTNTFSVSFEMTVGFYLYSLHIVYYIDWVLYTESTLHSYDKPHFIIVYYPFDVCWIQFVNTLINF